MDIFIFIMLLCGGLFAGGTLAITWSKLSSWKTLTFLAFKDDFGRTIRIADTLQPILLAMALFSTVCFALRAQGQARLWAWLAVGGYAITMAASVIILVPLQRKIISFDKNKRADDLAAMRHAWNSGHMGRTGLAIASFALVSLAVSTR